MPNATDNASAQRERLIRAVVPDEDAASFLERVNSRRSAWPPRPRTLLFRLPSLFARLNYGWGPLPHNVIEVYGMSNSGKTELLLSLITVLLVPRKWGGLSLRVAFFDNSCKLDLARLAELVRTRVASWSAKQAPSAQEKRQTAPLIDTVVDEALQNLTVFRCESTVQFLATLASFRQDPRACSTEEEGRFDAIFVDSLVPFFHGDKVLERAGGAQLYSIICRSLRAVVFSLGAVAFVVTPALYARSYGDAERGARGRGGSGGGGGRGRFGTGYNSAAVRSLYHMIEQAPVPLSPGAKSVLFPLLPRLTLHAACLDRCWGQLFTHRIVLTRLGDIDATQVRGSSNDVAGQDGVQSVFQALALVTALREDPRSGTSMHRAGGGPVLSWWKKTDSGGGGVGGGKGSSGDTSAASQRDDVQRGNKDIFFVALGAGECRYLA